MMKRLILFLIRRRLGLKKFQHFRFANQKTNAEYYFGNYAIMKQEDIDGLCRTVKSSVSLNWLLDDECITTTNI